MLFIGLTGGIASGKSTVSKMIQQKNIPVIDADKVAREVVEPGTKGLQAIASHFGEEILNQAGQLDRKKLGSIIFKDERERKQLNAIVHPAVRKRMQELKDGYVGEGHQVIVYDIPLLYESDLFHLVNKVLLVYVDPATQLTRLLERDQFTEQEARARIQSQMPLEEKKARANAVIDNTGTLEETERQLAAILKKWRNEMTVKTDK